MLGRLSYVQRHVGEIYGNIGNNVCISRLAKVRFLQFSKLEYQTMAIGHSPLITSHGNPRLSR